MRDNHTIYRTGFEEQSFRDDQCIILPGKSGNGKSILTAWLTANGYRYLTDELIFVSNTGFTLEEITPAKSCLYIIPSHVNARTLSGHGISGLSRIIRRCSSYKLVYGSF